MVILQSKKQKFHEHQRPIPIKIIDINEIVVSRKISFGKKGFKYFIDYKDAKKIRDLYIFLQKMAAYRSDFDETKYIYFLPEDHELLVKSNEIWEELKIVSKKNLIVNQYTMKNI